MFWRVPGPALLLAIVATISPYATSVTRLIAYMIGAVAWAPQVPRLMFGWSNTLSMLTEGTTIGPMAAGVRSRASLPSSLYIGALAMWALALVASKTMSMPSCILRKPAAPSWVVA